ncbi:serine hydrolase domain-containing protein [Scopulibacillus cellulosilyticus]|uniref:Serine hydrolase domain-containing protein n=1 Tax=Scopulibacillus cellulosilyticus TaxID=2665665 RepID=A0ABW2PX47_9BACL
MRKTLSIILSCFIISGAFLMPGDTVNAKEDQQIIEQKSNINKDFLPNACDYSGQSSPVLHAGSAKDAHMRQKPLKMIDNKINKAIKEKVMPGAVVLIARSGIIVKERAYGYALKYKDADFSPLKNPIKMTKNTIFDLASISKLFTTVAALQLYEQGKFQLNDPVVNYLPGFAKNGKEKVTIKQLMTHTSGFPSRMKTSLFKIKGSHQDKLQYVLKYPLKNQPGSTYTYSDLNMMTLEALIEKLSGERLDEFVKKHVTAPLGMKDTMYNPGLFLKARIAATEYQPWTDRGLVWGQVHDEKAWALGGTAGHAGIFSTASDLAKFSQMLLNGGCYKGKRILKPSTVQLMETNQLSKFQNHPHGLGVELGQEWYMDALTAPNTMGHTGFTGTSVVISPKNNTIVILLTNRVHPTRHTPSINNIRRTIARLTADAIY